MEKDGQIIRRGGDACVALGGEVGQGNRTRATQASPHHPTQPPPLRNEGVIEMATLAPSGRGKTRRVIPNINREQLSAALHPWRRRLSLQQTLTWTGRGMITGLILACLLLLISRLLPWATASYWAFGVGTACFLAAFAAALWFRPSLSRTTRL